VPQVVPVRAGLDYRLPDYDLGAFLIEAELLLDWYLPRFEITVAPSARAHFVTLWSEALKPALDAAPTWVLRDYHSPNLLWLEDRRGVSRIGILDFQDAVLGPAAYDVASLLQDARIEVPEALEAALFERYAAGRRAGEPDFDVVGFERLYTVLAAQRATKILGIFSRLERRDGKAHYLRHMPRVWRHLRRSLAHEALKVLFAWYRSQVPEPRSV
jgi:N-acetylmuramate 1-kinase